MRRISALFVVLALVAAGCGGADDDPPPATEAAAPTTVATTEAPPPPTTAPPPPTTTEAPPPTTAAPPPTTTEAPPPTTEASAGTALPGAVEGALLEGETPAGFDTLQTATNIPRPETCPGTPAYGGLLPVAYSEAVWAADPLTGPFLDLSITRFESVDVASEAFNNYKAEIVACGEFPEPSTGAIGAFTYGEDPALGDESFGTDYTATFQGLPVNRYGVLVRVGDSIYSSGATHVFVDPDKATVLEALSTFLGQ
ncbi:MAG: hypothetical protein F4117_06015 [Acidimicrobiales bacterium]|nr:hypothetical protein [Acidimicrobiales bacterium]MYB83022.1 hypothetical protein [Acidimicrobiales bacterium]MYI12106.1 hypothetical protein [Acidimicrobiales bacterium]MYK72303.1 hypothetical protein [Acidimicrobiales bacterium]